MAQTTLSTAPAPPAATADSTAIKLPMIEIEKLVAPIALYPDVLVAQILPAATFPMDVVMAARWLRSKPDMSKLLEQPWDPSVLSLCHYPQVLFKLDENLDWTNALGAAFLNQPQDVMRAIQDLREKAKAAGVLQTNKEQTVVTEDDSIMIVPTEPEVVYVPDYNPQVIYVEDDDDLICASAVTTGAVGFAAGFAMGAWLDMDCDWDDWGVAYCHPGYWGGYAHVHPHGRVVWGDDWAAAVGPRRAAVVGEHGGAYRGPRGGAVWTDDGRGAAWTRGRAGPRPTYTGRYATQYGRYSTNVAQVNRNRFYNSRDVTVNRNNINIDRGDRTSINRGDTNIAKGGDRTGVNLGDRTAAAGGDRTNIGRDARGGGSVTQPRSGYSSAFSRGGGSSATKQASQRGQQSRAVSGSGSRSQPSRAAPASTAQRSSGGSRSSSAFSGSRSPSQTRQSSARGSASRGGGGRGGRR
jgi:hypothetical protein